MVSQIHLVRHAEAVHNVSKDFSKLDPALTPLGFGQASKLVQTFPNSTRIGFILTSPLKRAIQTTLSAFPHVLDRRYFDPDSKLGVEGGAKLILDADLQERSALPCDTGSDLGELKNIFPHLEFEALGKGWQAKDGLFAADDEAVNKRAKREREKLEQLIEGLKGNQKNDVVVVTHGVFMKFLSGDQAIDLPKAGWKSYTIGHEAGETVLVPVIETELT